MIVTIKRVVEERERERGTELVAYQADGCFPKKVPGRQTVFAGLSFVSSVADKTSKVMDMCLTHGGGMSEPMPDASSASEWRKGQDLSKVYFVWQQSICPDDASLKAFGVLALRFVDPFSWFEMLRV